MMNDEINIINLNCFTPPFQRFTKRLKNVCSIFLTFPKLQMPWLNENFNICCPPLGQQKTDCSSSVKFETLVQNSQTHRDISAC